MTRGPAAARAFFEAAAGRTVEAVSMVDGAPYSVCSAAGKPVAGIMDWAGSEFGVMPPCWVTYIHVADADAACEPVTAGGGRGHQPCFDALQVGRIAIIRDPTSALAGIITPAAKG